MRYRFYREHKYVSSALNDVERLIAKADFCDVKSVEEVRNAFCMLAAMLSAHAEFEEQRIHRLLKLKNSSIQNAAEQDHAEQEESLRAISAMIDDLMEDGEESDKIEKGYALYLNYRKFVADNLLHLHEEETLLLPELRRLYSDDELVQVAASAYREMLPEHMVEMVKGLFPHMNVHDRGAFLTTMRKLEPEKFAIAWRSIRELVSNQERIPFDRSDQ